MDFEKERELEDAGIVAFNFSLMDEDERREALEDAGLDPDDYEDIEFATEFEAWEDLQSSGLSLWELDLMDEEEKREALDDAGLDPDDYEEDSYPFIVPQLESSAEPTAPLQSAPSEKPESPHKTYQCAQVRFPNSTGAYSYRIDERVSGVKVGDKVIVPVGPQNRPTTAQIILLCEYTEADAPYPPEKMKWVTEIAKEETLPPVTTPRPPTISPEPPVTTSETAPPMDTTQGEATMTPSIPPETYRYAQLRFLDSDALHFYRVSDDIHVGDEVIVPTGTMSEPKVARVMSIGDYTAKVAPFPPEKARWARKRSVFKPVAPAQSKVQVTDKANGSGKSLTSNDADTTRSSLGRSNRSLKILSGILAAAVLILTVLLLSTQRTDSEEDRTVEISSPSQTMDEGVESQTPAQAATTQETNPDPVQLNDTQTKEHIDQMIIKVNNYYDYIIDYSSEMWEPESVSVSHEKIKEYEATWSEHHSEAVELLEELDRFLPSDTYRSSWQNLRELINNLVETAEILSDWDLNGDGDYTTEECSAVNNSSLQKAQEGKSAADGLAEAYSQVTSNQPSNANSASSQSENSSSKSSSSYSSSASRSSGSSRITGGGSPPSDPYNAKDYYNPEDFYDDNYDDFWDYEEAEDYWNEWND